MKKTLFLSVILIISILFCMKVSAILLLILSEISGAWHQKGEFKAKVFRI